MRCRPRLRRLDERGRHAACATLRQLRRCDHAARVDALRRPRAAASPTTRASPPKPPDACPEAVQPELLDEGAEPLGAELLPPSLGEPVPAWSDPAGGAEPCAESPPANVPASSPPRSRAAASPLPPASVRYSQTAYPYEIMEDDPPPTLPPPPPPPSGLHWPPSPQGCTVVRRDERRWAVIEEAIGRTASENG